MVLIDNRKGSISLEQNRMQKASKYFRRLLKVRQMDFEYAFWQMLQLLVSPSKV